VGCGYHLMMSLGLGPNDPRARLGGIPNFGPCRPVEQMSFSLRTVHHGGI
jgi:hypothetical protein